LSPYAMGPLPFPAPAPVAMQPQVSDDEALLRNFLETGSTEFIPSAPQGNQFTPEQWQIAAMSGDPMGVREIYDKTATEASEQEFIKQLSTIDWNASDAADRVVKMIGANPKGFTKQTASMMELFSEIGGKKPSTDLTKIAGYGTAALNKYNEVMAATNDPARAMAAVADLAAASKAASAVDDDRLSLSTKQKEALADQYEASANSSEPSDEEKMMAYNKKYGTSIEDPDDMPKDKWDEAKALVLKARQSGISDLVRQYTELGFRVPKEMERFLPSELPVKATPAGAAVVPTVDPAAAALARVLGPSVVPAAAGPTPAQIDAAVAPVAVPVVEPPTERVFATPYADKLKDIESKIPEASGIERLALIRERDELKAASTRESSRQKDTVVEDTRSEGTKDLVNKMDASIEQILSKVDNFEEFKASWGAPGALIRKLGFEPRDVAFTTSDGRKILWNEVGYRMFQSPKVMALMSGEAALPEPAKTAKAPTGIKVIRKVTPQK
jgi:hypothetical protein